MARRLPLSAANGRGRIAALFVFAALVMGGGGSSAPFSELLLQIAAALAAAAWLLAPGQLPTSGQAVRADWRIWVLSALVLALPCLQLLPLPPSLWQQLPGREQERVAAYLAGNEAGWMPWSMTPSRTFASLLAMLPPLLAMAMVAKLNREQRGVVISAIAVTVLASLLFGALQLSAGSSGDWRPYGNDNLGFLNGFQANRNAQADVLLIGLVAGAVTLRERRDRIGRILTNWLLGGLVLSIVLGCVLTGSRAGIVLIPIALAAVVGLHFARRIGLRGALGGLAGSIGALIVGYIALRGTGPVSRVIARFSLGRDFRFELWEDTRFAIAQYWPFGSGIGSFKPVFVAAERLEVVDPSKPVRAHNDYLELALEGGVFGLGLLALAAIWLGWILWRAWRSPAHDAVRGDRSAADSTARGQVIFAVAVFLIIALHSVVDYPLRSMALACLAGVAAGLLTAAPSSRNDLEFAGK